MFPFRRTNRLLAGTVMVLAGLARAATGQTVWDGSQSNLWRIAENWTPAVVPNNMTDVEVGAPAPTVVDSVAVARDLTVLAAGRIEIQSAPASGLTVAGSELNNDGLITINSNNGSPATTLVISSGATIDGSGEIVLAAAGNLARLAAGVMGFTHGADHTIRGEGQVTGNFVNEGTIIAEDADGSGMGSLQIGDSAAGDFRTNNGVIRSSADGELVFVVRMNQGDAGRIIADGGTVFLNNSTIHGGTLESLNGGVFETTGNSLKLGALKLTGQIDMVSVGPSVPTITLEGGGITNDGTIVVQANAAPGNGAIQAVGPALIDGAGEIVLNREGLGARITGSGEITNGQNHTIRGVGTIEAPFVNEGTVIAAPQGGGSVLVLSQLGAATMTNNSVMRADAGGVLRLSAVRVTQDADDGRIVANEGVVELHGSVVNSALVSGGRFETVGAGRIDVTANTRVDNITNQGTFNILPGRQLTVRGPSLVNNGAMTLTNNTGPSFSAASLIIDDNVTIGGTGDIVLADTVSPVAVNRINVNSGFTATQAAGRTIRGEGLINGPGTFVNNGRLEGTSASRFLEVNASLTGTGLLKNVRIDGTHSPGPGTVVVPLEGAYTINSFGGRLQMEIGGLTPGSGHDQLVSTDPSNVITIGSTQTTLEVMLTGGFVPENGDTFTLVQTAGMIVGGFAVVDLPDLPPGFFWDDVSTDQAIAYRAIAALAADFEEDNDVDANDLTRWKMGYGTAAGATHMGGDADEDEDVDGRDFLIWQAQFGTGVIASGAGNVVPEPASALLAAAAWRLAIGRTRRRVSRIPA